MLPVAVATALLAVSILAFKFFDRRPKVEVVMSPFTLHFLWKCRLCGATNEVKEVINPQQGGSE